MAELLTSDHRTFGSLPVFAYFVWVRAPELGPLMKANANEAVDESDQHRRIDHDEEVLV